MAKEELDICYELKKISNLVSRFKRRNPLSFDGKKLTRSQAQILEFIYDKSKNNETVYQKDIEKNFSIRRSTATESLNRIESLSLITRNISDCDARKKEIILTNKAKSYIDDIHNHLKEFASIVSEGITTEEKATLFNILRKMENNLKKQELIYEKNI